MRPKTLPTSQTKGIVRVLHAGLHKTGSTYLQRHIFPKLPGVNFHGNFSLGNFLRFGPDDFIGVPFLSSEASLGFPYPLTSGPNYERFMCLLDLFSITHVILVTRPFESWVRSLYFQLLKEGGTGSFAKWRATNADLEKWRSVVPELRQRLSATGRQLLVLSQEDLGRDQQGFVAAICKFIGTEPPVLTSLPRANVSRYGNVTIACVRCVNFLLPNGFVRDVVRKLRLDLRTLLLFGLLGKVTEALSWRRLL